MAYSRTISVVREIEFHFQKDLGKKYILVACKVDLCDEP